MRVGYVARRGNEISLENRETETRKTERTNTHTHTHTKGGEKAGALAVVVNGAL